MILKVSLLWFYTIFVSIIILLSLCSLLRYQNDKVLVTTQKWGNRGGFGIIQSNGFTGECNPDLGRTFERPRA